MAKVILNFFVWLFFSPLLIRTSERHWSVKTLLILFSPFTFFVFVMAVVTIYYATVPIYEEFTVPHRFKSSADIATAVDARIPACDTLGAKYCIVGNDYAVHEEFELKQVLSKKDLQYYTRTCLNVKYWEETDSTFEYRLTDPEREIIKEGYEYLYVIIPKKHKRMQVEFGCF